MPFGPRLQGTKHSSATMTHVLNHLDPLPTYTYTAVHVGHIRILEILPGQGEDLVVCLFPKFNLDKHTHYEALPNVWGDPTVLKSGVYIVSSADAGLPSRSSVLLDENQVHP